MITVPRKLSLQFLLIEEHSDDPAHRSLKSTLFFPLFELAIFFQSEHLADLEQNCLEEQLYFLGRMHTECAVSHLEHMRGHSVFFLGPFNEHTIIMISIFGNLQKKGPGMRRWKE